MLLPFASILFRVVKRLIQLTPPSCKVMWFEPYTFLFNWLMMSFFGELPWCPRKRPIPLAIRECLNWLLCFWQGGLYPCYHYGKDSLKAMKICSIYMSILLLDTIWMCLVPQLFMDVRFQVRFGHRILSINTCMYLLIHAVDIVW